MDAVAVIVVDYALKEVTSTPLNQGLSSYDQVLLKAKSLDFPVFTFSIYPKEHTLLFKGDLYSLLLSMDFLTKDFQHFLFLHTHEPLIDLSLTQEIINTHLKNIADYTMAEHYPQGFAPFMINGGTFKKLLLMAYGNNQPYESHVLDKMIQNDINSYDVEIVIAPEDLRKVRESFVVLGQRETLMCQEFLKNPTPATHLGEWFLNHSHVLRPMPALFNIELISTCQQNCIACPKKLIKEPEKKISVEQFKLLMQEIASWVQKGRIELSGFGEPLTHPDIKEILHILKDYPQFEYFLETNGLLLDQYTDDLLTIPSLQVFISLDAPNSTLYKDLRGEGFEKAEENTEKFLSKNPHRGYIQITRMEENEEFIEKFLERWRAFKDRILIQKYNNFCKAFENKKVVDLSPLKRFACWKLQREMAIRADLSVPLCSQDFNKTLVIGKALETPLPEIWQKNNAFYQAHWKENFVGLCSTCDEWYIFD